MNSKQLTAFRAIMQSGSMTEAARRLGVSQPAISRLVRDLESSLGFSLFERRNSRLHPTQGARAFFREVERHFCGLERLSQSADHIRMMKSGSLCIGATPLLAETVLPEVLARFALGRDEVALNLAAHEPEELLQRVAGHQFDLALTELPAETGAVQNGPAYRSELRCIAAPGHRFAAGRRVRVEDLEREPFVPVGTADSLHYRRVEQLLRDHLIRPDESIGAGQFSVARGLVRAGFGVALVDPFSALRWAREGGISCSFEPAQPFCFGFVLPPGREPGALEQAFIDSFEAAVGAELPLQPVDPDRAAEL
ncbi:LysR family transcriptional regulator [Marinobacterium aestuariivivens]|uniref:LysR family transcriptional regulator n=1 Tax=Marinobacterium aestuariivivens TaxID=1698799 RepID=A0ABW1ZZF3_9GAMM